MATVPNGATITYTGTWPTGFFVSASDVLSAVSADLNTSGLIVRSSNMDAFFTTTLGGTFQVTLYLQNESGLDYASENDVISIIRHWVYQETDKYPNADTISYVQDAQGHTTPTGEPAAAQVTGCLAGTDSDQSGKFSLGCWFSNLTQKGLASVGFLAIMLLIGVAILFLAPRGRT